MMAVSRSIFGKLQDAEKSNEFPAHISLILNSGNPISCKEILCRLIHVCLIEVGFIPVIEEVPELKVEAMLDLTQAESVPMLVGSLRRIIDKVGNLHSVKYKAIVFEGTSGSSIPSASSLETFSEKSSKNISALLVTSVSQHSEHGSVIIPEEKRVYSDTVVVNILHEDSYIYAVASAPDFQRNFQFSFSQYVRPKDRWTEKHFPASATIDDYLAVMNFSIVRFVDDIKRTFCYPIMDQLDSLSFEIRSLSWLPTEIIVEIAQHSSPLTVFRLRATCKHFRKALSTDNQRFWKGLLERDYTYFNTSRLESEEAEDKYYRKYMELSRLSLRRPPFRRAFAQSRLFPYYFNNSM